MDTTGQTEAAVADAPAGGAEAGFRKVLVVDDDPAMRRIVSRILTSAGYEVTCAVNGFEAMEVMEHDFPSFVITDWDMPVLDGTEFCRMVREKKLPHYIYLVMLTGSYTDRLVEGLSSGADDFITKPVKPQELLARMLAGARVLKLEEQLRLLAARDPLTDLLNRRTFFEILDQEWRQSRRSGGPLSCVMIDVDFFKAVNDTHGHATGDAVLKGVSQRIAESCRRSDCVCRYGGEEFCVLLPDTTEQGAALWAEHCRAAIAEMPLVAGQSAIRVTASFGVAQQNHAIDTPEKLLDLADQALLAAKRLGRNRVVV